MAASRLHQREAKKINPKSLDDGADVWYVNLPAQSTKAETIKSDRINQLGLRDTPTNSQYCCDKENGASTSTNSRYVCDKDHSCDRCDFSSSNSSTSIKEHLKQIRDGWDTFNCEVCTFSTFCHDTLHKHVMEVHVINDDYYDSKYEKYEKQRATSGSRFSMNNLKFSFSVGYDCAYVLIYYALMVMLFVAAGVIFVYLYYFYRHTFVFLFKIHSISGTLPVNSSALNNQTIFMVNKN